MNPRSKTGCLKITRSYFLFTIFISLTFASKYSEKANIASRNYDELEISNEEKPFRMQKMNLLWTKAKKKLYGTKLAELYADLKIHDKHEAHLKKLRADGLDKDGAMEAKVLTSYRRIVERFALDEFFPNDDMFISNEIPNDEGDKKGTHFQDPKLQTMWARAEQAGFSESDLQLLKQEFWHQQMKLDEFDFVHRELSNVEDPDDNSVDFDQRKANLSPMEAKDKKTGLKKAKRDIKEGYMRLESLVASTPGEEPLFKDSRVHKLWALAKKTNWTQEELDSFKEELKHFEHRLGKQAFYKEQLEMSMKSLGKVKDGDDIPEEHLALEEKNQLLNQRVKKLHTNLKSRIDKGLKHMEL